MKVSEDQEHDETFHSKLPTSNWLNTNRKQDEEKYEEEKPKEAVKAKHIELLNQKLATVIPHLNDQRNMDVIELENNRLKDKYKVAKGPTKKLIEEMDSRICEFDINRIHCWNPENMRKFKTYVTRFENHKVIYNIMLLDKQYQDLISNHKLIMFIRNNEK